MNKKNLLKIKISIPFKKQRKRIDKKFIFIFFLTLLVFFAYRQSLILYIGKDDWDLFFQVVQYRLLNLGPVATGPYKYAPSIFYYLYPLLGLNFHAYFIVGLILRILAALSLYLLIFELSIKKSIAIAVCLLFAVFGYIGMETNVFVQHLYAMMGTITLSCITLWLLLKHFRTNKLFYYVLSLLVFAFTSEFFVLRAHGLIFSVLSLTILFADVKKEAKKIFITFCKLLPFLLIYNFEYHSIYSGGSAMARGPLSVFSSLSSLSLFVFFPQTFANGVIPDALIGTLYNLFSNNPLHLHPNWILIGLSSLVAYFLTYTSRKRFLYFLFIIATNILFLLFTKWSFAQPLIASVNYSEFYIFTAYVGEQIILILLLLLLRGWKAKKIQSRLILFGLLWFFSQYIGYFVAAPATNLLVSYQRYQAIISVGSAIMLGTIFFYDGIKKINILLFISTLVVLMSLLHAELSRIVERRIPTESLYKSMQSQMPTLPKDPVIFFDYKNDPPLIDAVGDSHPDIAVSLFYGLRKTPVTPTSLDAILTLIKQGKTTIDNIVTFYIDSTGAKNTTEAVRKLLANASSENQIDVSRWSSNTPSAIDADTFTANPLTFERDTGTVGVNPMLKVKMDAISVAPMLLSINISAFPLQLSAFSLPYQDVTNKVLENVTTYDLTDIRIDSKETANPFCSQLSNALEEEKQHRDFLLTARVSGTSPEYDNNPNSKVSNLIDGKTNWSPDIAYWNRNKSVEFTFDLGSFKTVTRFNWLSHLKRTTPTDYTIFAMENNAWKEIKSVKNGPIIPDDTLVTEQLPKTEAQYLKMVITATASGLAPSLKGAWIDGIEGLSNEKGVQDLIQQPFACPIFSEYEANTIVRNVSLVKAKLSLKTNANNDFVKTADIYIHPDGTSHWYSFYLPAGGTTLEEIKIDGFQIPLNITITGTTIRSLSFQEIDDLGYISTIK